MPSNNKIKIKAKEIKYTSIAEYNLVNKTSFYLFNPKNITGFKCKIGTINNKKVYIREHLECMWGNDKIDEYVLFDDFYLDQFENFKKDENVNVLNFNGIDVFYTYKKALFGDSSYNAVCEINNVRYCLIIKTIKKERFFNLMKEFFEMQFNFNN